MSKQHTITIGHDSDGEPVELNPEYAKLAEQRIAKTLNPSTHRTDNPADSPLFAGGAA